MAGSFKSQWGYDSADQVAWMKYPDGNSGNAGEQVNYTYKPQMLPDSASGEYGYVPLSMYDAAGRVIQRRYGGSLGSPTLMTDFTYYAWALLLPLRGIRGMHAPSG